MASDWLSPLSPPSSLSVRSLGSLSPFTGCSSSSSSPSCSVLESSDLDSGYASSSQSALTSEPGSPTAAALPAAAAARRAHSGGGKHSATGPMARHTMPFDYSVEGGDSQELPAHQPHQPPQQHNYRASPSHLQHGPPPPHSYPSLSSMSLLHSAALASPSTVAAPSASSLFSPSLDALYSGHSSSATASHPYSSIFNSLHSPSPSASFSQQQPYSVYHSQQSAMADMHAAGTAVPVQPILPPSAFRRSSHDQQRQSMEPAAISSVRASIHSTAIYPPPSQHSAGSGTGLSTPQSPPMLASASSSSSSSRFLPHSFGYAPFPSPSFASPSHFPSHVTFGSLTEGALPSPGFPPTSHSGSSSSSSNPFVLPVQPYQPPSASAFSSSSHSSPSHFPSPLGMASSGFQSSAQSAFNAGFHGRRSSTESAESQSPLHLPLAPSLMPSPSQPQPNPNPFAIPYLPPADSTAAEHRALSDGDSSQQQQQQLTAAFMTRIKTEPADVRAYQLSAAAHSSQAAAATAHSLWSGPELLAAPSLLTSSAGSSVSSSLQQSSSSSSRPGGAMGSIRPCSLCGVSLLHDFDEVQHALYVHSRHLCILCRHQSADFAGHALHLSSHNTGQLPFSCSLCGKGFNKKFNMSTHFASHSALKRHECPICRQLYSQKSYLRLHMRTHSGLKPYKCDWPGCGKAFGMRSDVKKHQRVHSGEKPYTCKQCGRSFNHSSNFNRHRRKRTQTCSPDTAPLSSNAAATRPAPLPAHNARQPTAGHGGTQPDDEDEEENSVQQQQQRWRAGVQRERGAAGGGSGSEQCPLHGRRGRTVAPTDGVEASRRFCFTRSC